MDEDYNPEAQVGSGVNGQTVQPIGNSNQPVSPIPSQPIQTVQPVRSTPPSQPIPPVDPIQPVAPSSSLQGVQAEQPSREGQWLKSDNLNQQSFYVEENVKAENKKKVVRKVLAIVLPLFLFLILASGGLASYFLFVKPPSPEKLLKEALNNSMQTDLQSTYLSIDINAINEKYTGEIQMDSEGNLSKGRLDEEVKTYFDDAKQEPVDIKLERIVTKNGENEERYEKFKQIGSPVREIDYYTKYIFGGVVDKWVKYDKEESTDEDNRTLTFEDNGSLVILGLIDAVMPMGNYQEEDRKAFWKLAKKYHLYQLGEEVEEELFKGVDARKIDVIIKKDALKEFQNEVKQALSSEAKYQPLDSGLMDKMFGTKNEVSVELYAKIDEAKIIGINYVVNLPAPIESGFFQALIQKITTNVFIEYDRELILDIPQSYLTEEEFQNKFNLSL